MKTVPKILLPLPLLLPHVPPLPPATDADVQAIVADESLADLRGGGRLCLADPLAPGELEVLLAADVAGEDLAALRGGEISNSDLTTVLLILAIVALIVIIL